MIADLIDNALLIESLDAKNKHDLLDEMLVCAVEAGLVKSAQRPSLRKALLAREANGSTGIGNGVAVPHVKAKSRESVLLILGRSATGVPYQAVDGRDVESVFMVIGPESAAEDHLQVLRWVSGLARNADFRRFLKAAASTDEIRELLREMGTS